MPVIETHTCIISSSYLTSAPHIHDSKKKYCNNSWPWYSQNLGIINRIDANLKSLESKYSAGFEHELFSSKKRMLHDNQIYIQKLGTPFRAKSRVSSFEFFSYTPLLWWAVYLTILQKPWRASQCSMDPAFLFSIRIQTQKWS